MRPLLLIDVDGPLNPYAAAPTRRPDGYRTHRMRPAGWENPWEKPLRVWLNPAHGPALQALPFDLVWCTTWQAEANEWIGPHLGLPHLPVITWPDGARHEPRDGVFWKTGHVVDWAAGRPFAWIDDDVTDRDRAYVAAHHDGPALLHHVSPRLGLLDPDFRALADWAADIGGQVAQR
ncbi:hypothetical protein ACIBL6_41070 [Streptomyces sp. NPDC050400]|uniref:hypothetical protein n=1 Tax=Streptomyces sp. NPDC050400 TaxID=3365610 RepID=UPI00379BAB7C